MSVGAPPRNRMSPSEKRYKARRLARKAEEDHESDKDLEEEDEVKKKALRKRLLRACEGSFHALVETGGRRSHQ